MGAGSEPEKIGLTPCANLCKFTKFAVYFLETGARGGVGQRPFRVFFLQKNMNFLEHRLPYYPCQHSGFKSELWKVKRGMDGEGGLLNVQ